MSPDNRRSDEEDFFHWKSSRSDRHVPSGRRKSAGRRSGDHDMRTTFTRKFLVIAVAMINAVYLVSEVFLGINAVDCL